MTNDCCAAGVIARYEAIDPEMAETAKARGNVALFCEVCQSRVVFEDGEWKTVGA